MPLSALSAISHFRRLAMKPEARERKAIIARASSWYYTAFWAFATLFKVENHSCSTFRFLNTFVSQEHFASLSRNDLRDCRINLVLLSISTASCTCSSALYRYSNTCVSIYGFSQSLTVPAFTFRSTNLLNILPNAIPIAVSSLNARANFSNVVS